MTRSRALRTGTACAALAAAAAVCGAGAGCYSRVVKETGIGRGTKQIYEPNVDVPEDNDQWNLAGSSSNPGIKNWKAAGQKPKPKPTTQD